VKGATLAPLWIVSPPQFHSGNGSSIVVVVVVVVVSLFIFTKAKNCIHSLNSITLQPKTDHILVLSNGCHRKYKNGRVKVDLG